MTSMLEGVVRVGTGTAANLEPYTVAGKTGTALVPLPDGGYSSDDFVSSFAGFAPAEDPAITAMVVVVGTHQYGAQASAPVFGTIVRDSLQELGIPPHKAARTGARRPAGDPLWRRGRGGRAGSAGFGGYARRPGRPVFVALDWAKQDGARVDYDDGPLGSGELDEAECALEDSARSGRLGRCLVSVRPGSGADPR